MPLFMDVHRSVDGSLEDVKNAHAMDVETQEAYGVNYKQYWVDESTGTIFCLFEGPDKESGIRVHEEAHGLTADEVFEVVEGE